MSGLAALLLLGISVQWLAWRLRLPSILLLLLAGFAIGPLAQPLLGRKLVDPDALLGETLLPFVSLSVAVILFEGGLSLKLRELRGAGPVVLQLVLLGPPITFALATLAGLYTLGLDLGLCALLGAILVVTGPTVIVPLLRHVRPSGSVGRVILWEGIVTDPIGAIVAVLVFQTLVHTGPTSDIALRGAGLALLGGGVAGLVGAVAIVLLLRRDLIPDFLQAAVVLAIALAAFLGANEVQHEAGLLAVTLMGVVLANQRQVSIEHVVEFKENLRVLLLSVLFLLLAARLPLEEFTNVDLRSVGYLLALVLVVRPLAVLIATAFSRLGWRERLFIAWMAPRGVVVAAVTSVFALQLVLDGHPGAERLVPIAFLVILGTVAIYGLSALPLARRLGLARDEPQGVLFVGAHEWARRMALALHKAGVETLLVDTNHHEVQSARLDGLEAHYGSVLSDDLSHVPQLESLGHVVAVTTNDHVNALACLHLAPLFGRSSVHQLAPGEGAAQADLPPHLRGRVLFAPEADFWTIEHRFRRGALVKATKLGPEHDYEAFRRQYERDERPVIPLFVKSAAGRVRVVKARDGATSGDFEPGDTLFALVDPIPDEAPASPQRAAAR